MTLYILVFQSIRNTEHGEEMTLYNTVTYTIN